MDKETINQKQKCCCSVSSATNYHTTIDLLVLYQILITIKHYLTQFFQ